jgi:hypothetical protein
MLENTRRRIYRHAYQVWLAGVAAAPLVVVACDPELVVDEAPFAPAVVEDAPDAAVELASTAPVGSSLALAQ